MWMPSIPKRLHTLLRPKRVAILEACIIGLVSGVAAVVLKQGVRWLGGLRIQSTEVWPAWIALPLIGLVGGYCTGWLVQVLAPEAAGSGIPQVKAALAYVPIPLNLRVAIVKLISTTLALGSGLTLGRQGPTVQIGAALAAWLSRWVPTSPEYRRQLIAAGAAAGLASGFNAPIAGVLLVVEEFLQDFSDLTLGTAILASFIGAVVSRVLGGEGLNLTMQASQASFSLQDIPFFLLLGLLAGLLGALFNRGLFATLAMNRRLVRFGLPGMVAIAGLISGLGSASLPASFRDNAGLREFLITGNLTWEIALMAFCAKFVLTLLAYGSGAPGGLFAPALILGSALGSLVGQTALILQTWVGTPLGLPPDISATTTYALAGMGTFFSAVTRVPVTAIVIVFEMTMDFNLVLPLMIGSVIAFLIADRFDPGSIYTRLLARNGIVLDSTPAADRPWAKLSAVDVMQRRVETLSSQMSLQEAMEAFSRSHHRGFPVVDQGRLVGIVSQSDLSEAASRQSTEICLQDIMTPNPVTVTPSDPLTHVLYLLDRYKLSRLPVTEGHKLVGIITRADIIRAESDQLSGKVDQLGPQPEPSYGVYQTRSPATGKGRLLVPLSNPETAPVLIQMAMAIARDRQYELECLQIIVVPRNISPAEAEVQVKDSRRLLNQARHLGKRWKVPVHTQIRVAHEVSNAVLETIKDRHIDLILMGWKGSTATPGRVFGSVVDTLIRQAACEVILVKLGDTLAWDRWLVPIAGGPNARCAIKRLPALTTLGSDSAEIVVCQVFSPEQKLPQKTEAMLEAVHFLQAHLGEEQVRPVCAIAPSVPDQVLQLAYRYQSDVILLGMSRESLLQHVIQGNIPETITKESSATVILVRGALSGEDQPG